MAEILDRKINEKSSLVTTNTFPVLLFTHS